MPEPKPSNDFLFFQPPLVLERLYAPTFYLISFGSALYVMFVVSYALFLSPLAFRVATVILLVVSSAVTLLALNVYWAYEGNYTHRKKRPCKSFKNGSKFRCAYRHIMVACLCVFILGVHVYEAIPHALLHFMGKSGVHELIIENKRVVRSRYNNDCRKRLVAYSSEYRSDYLCVESDELHAEVNVGDILIVEGKANWIGLLVDKPLALRDAESGLERSVYNLTRQQPLVQVDGARLIPKTGQFW